MRTRALAVLIVAGTVLAGCGSSGAKPNGEASKSPLQVVKDAVGAASTAKGVHVSGTIVTGKQRLTIDFRIVQGRGGAGTITEQGLSFRFVRIDGKAYIKGTDAFYRQFAGAATAALLHDKWLEADATTGAFASLTGLTDIAELIQQGLASHGTLRNTGETTYRGQKAVGIDDTTKHGTLYIAATGRPYPVAIVNKGSSEPGTVTFDEWNTTVSLVAPKGAIDLSKLGTN
jgi:hypothetical protein